MTTTTENSEAVSNKKLGIGNMGSGEQDFNFSEIGLEDLDSDILANTVTVKVPVRWAMTYLPAVEAGTVSEAKAGQAAEVSGQ